MSGVHGVIALAAADVLPADLRELFAPYRADLDKAAWYPDSLGDKKMPEAAKLAIDPEADRFWYPDEPQNDTQRRLYELTDTEARTGVTALRQAYLTEHYLRAAVQAARAGDVKAAVKFCGVYSHTIADTAEPIHAINPDIIDLVVPPPPSHMSLELHAGVEGLGAPVDIRSHQPRLLGRNVEQAVMGAIAGLVHAKQVGAAQTVPIVQALYADNRVEATRLSSLAQSESARQTADFMYTVFWLANIARRPSESAINLQSSDKTKGIRIGPGQSLLFGEHPEESGKSGADTARCAPNSELEPEVVRHLDLCNYPYVGCLVDMLYRYRPMVDLSLIPYSGGKSHPLSLRTTDSRGRLSHNGIEQVHGLGVAPYLGPPYTPDHHRVTTVDYFLIPGAYNMFRARVGANPLFKTGIVTLVFRVLADGKEVFRSRDLLPTDAPVEVAADIAGARWLTLSMHFSSNPTFEDVQRLVSITWPNHGVWAEPRLE
jgi:hypothetical protein